MRIPGEWREAFGGPEIVIRATERRRDDRGRGGEVATMKEEGGMEGWRGFSIRYEGEMISMLPCLACPFAVALAANSLFTLR